MKIPGASSGNTLLNSVMAQQSTSGSYAERSLHGKQVGINLQHNEMGKAANQVLKTSAEEDAEIIEENIKKAAEKKAELEKTEAQRIAQKQEEASKSTPAPAAQGDTVEISDAGLEAAKDVTVAVSPPEVAAVQTTPSLPASSAPVANTHESPKAEQTV